MKRVPFSSYVPEARHREQQDQKNTAHPRTECGRDIIQPADPNVGSFNTGDVSDDTDSSNWFASALIPELPPYNPKWPSYMMQLMNSPLNGDDWTPVMLRILSHPHEIAISGTIAGHNAFHVAVLRYPPVHAIKAMIQAAPHCVAVPNNSLEVPLHLASSSSSEEVQELLIRAAPQTVKMQDRCGDTPLHFAAREGATYSLLELMVKSAPEAISIQNHRGVTPFWILPRSYLHSNTFESIFASEDGSYFAGNDDESGEESSAVVHYASDWRLLKLFLRFSYYDPVEALRLQNLLRLQADMNLPQIADNYHWMVHAAAKTPSCPREILQFLCTIFPEALSIVDDQGYTPLHYACMAPIMIEPEWNEQEDGFRENEPSAPSIDERSMPQIPEVVLVDFGGDVDFLRNQMSSLNAAISSQSTGEDSDDSKKRSVLDIVLESNLSVAYIPDRAGRFPLAYAILSRKCWRDMKRLIAANPKALEQVDQPTGNPMFILAASAGKELSQLNTLYHIVRLLPGALMDLTKRSSAKP